MLEFIDTCLTEASNIFELNLKKVNVVVEAARRELAINYNEAELKVMQENGTDEDLAYYYSEAENGLIDTIIKAIKKIKDAIIKFFSEMKSKVIALITKKENTEAIAKVEKKVKIFPLLGRKKILVEDYNKEAKIADESLSKLGKLKAKLKGKQEVTSDEVDEVKKSFFEEHGAAIGIGSAVSVTVVAAIAAVKHMTSKAKSETDKYQNIATKTCDDCLNMLDSVDNPVVAQKIADATSSVAKTAQESYIRTLKNMMQSIGNAVRTFGKSKADVNKAAAALGESTDNSDSMMTDAEMKKITDSVASAQSSNGDMTEMGDDPSDCMPGFGDDPEDTSDVWDDVMGTTAGLDIDDIDDGYPDNSEKCGTERCGTEKCGTEKCGTEGCDTEGCGTEKCGTEGCGSRFESAFDELLEKVSNYKEGASGYGDSYTSESSDEDEIDSLFNEISEEVRDNMSGSDQCTSESAFDRLMGEIDNLFD